MSLLQLPDLPDVAWARLVEGAGEGGSYAYQIDASGNSVRNRMMYRQLIPNGGSPAMKTRMRLKSTLTANNPAFEGVAVRHRGFQLTGTVPSRADKLVWDSDPDTKGARAWYAEQSGTFTDAVFIEPVPEFLGIDYVTFELIVRAPSGQVTISNIECRNHYAAPYDISVLGNKFWSSGFQIEAITEALGSNPALGRWVQYVLTNNDAKIRRGKLVTIIHKCAMSGRAFETTNSDPSSAQYQAQRMGAGVGIMLKMRRVGGAIYDTFTLFNSPVTRENRTAYSDGSNQFRAQYDYDQTEVQFFVEPGSRSDGFFITSVDRLETSGAEIEMIVADYIAPSQ